MSGSSTPAVGRQEKTMSSRLLTMKFMQRSAASHPSPPPATPTSSSVPGSSPAEPNGGHPAKRSKLSSSLPQSPNHHYASTPGSVYQSDDPRTPLASETLKRFTPQNHAGDAAETRWVSDYTQDVLVTRQQQQQQQQQREPIPPPEEEEEEVSPPEAVIGRRTFGDFKKKTATSTTTTKAPHKRKTTDPDESNDVSNDESNEDDDSLTSSDLEEDPTEHGPRTQGKHPPTRAGKSRSGPRRQEPDNDDDRRDRINLQKMRSGGISAAAGMGMRRSAGSRGEAGKYQGKKKRR